MIRVTCTRCQNPMAVTGMTFEASPEASPFAESPRARESTHDLVCSKCGASVSVTLPADRGELQKALAHFLDSHEAEHGWNGEPDSDAPADVLAARKLLRTP